MSVVNSDGATAAVVSGVEESLSVCTVCLAASVCDRGACLSAASMKVDCK